VARRKVAKVVGNDLKGDHIVVHMRVKGVRLGRLTKAEIKIKTVLGRKYVSLVPDGDGILDREIPVTRTTAPFDISPAFQHLAETVGGIDSVQLARSFTTLADDFRNSPAQVRASLDGLSRLSATIATRDAKLRALLHRAQGVTAVLANRDQDLVAFLRSSDQILLEVKARRQAIHTLLVTTTALSEQLIALVRENRANLAPALASLRGVAAMLRANQDNLDKSLAALAPFVRVFANNLGNGRWFDTYVYNLSNPSGFGPGTFGTG
jgi:phospholipid/cholesterol/gamma-HCH transport system substrate-binding protein